MRIIKEPFPGPWKAVEITIKEKKKKKFYWIRIGLREDPPIFVKTTTNDIWSAYGNAAQLAKRLGIISKVTYFTSIIRPSKGKRYYFNEHSLI